MPELRDCFQDAGFKEVRTYLQSGNVVLSDAGSPKTLARKSKALIAECFGLDIEVITRTRDELADVVRLNPLGKVAKDPKRYQVSFLAAEPKADVVKKLEGLVVKPEGFVVIGKEAYAWHPEGVAGSKLWNQLAGKGLGVVATARNWTTVTKLLEMADSV